MSTVSGLLEGLPVSVTSPVAAMVPGDVWSWPVVSTFASAPYLLRALVLVVVLSLTCALVGTLVNLRCAEFQVEALVHAVFPGIVLGLAWHGSSGIVPTAFVVGLGAAVVLTWIGSRARRESSEAGTAVVLTSFFSAGLVVLLAVGDRSGQLEALMFGRLLEVTDARLVQALVTCAIGAAVVLLTWKEQVCLAFDATAARASGLRPGWLDLVLNIAVAAVVVSGATAVGTLLVIGYVVLPAATGRLLGRSVRSLFLIAAMTGLLSGMVGLVLITVPASRPVSPQATIILVMALVLVTAAAWSRWVSRWTNRRGRPVAAPACRAVGPAGTGLPALVMDGGMEGQG